MVEQQKKVLANRRELYSRRTTSRLTLYGIWTEYDGTLGSAVKASAMTLGVLLMYFSGFVAVAAIVTGVLLR